MVGPALALLKDKSTEIEDLDSSHGSTTSQLHPTNIFQPHLFILKHRDSA